MKRQGNRRKRTNPLLQPEPQNGPKRPIVVGIGASAGGLESLMAFLKALPADTGMSFVIVQHLDARQVSHLPSLLARATSMPVVEVKQSASLYPNYVYVVPPGRDISIERNHFEVVPRVKHSGADGQIDGFFLSLANDRGEGAIGVVLSGTGSDGTQGLREIKQRGGITFAEAKSSAKFFGMPQSAIAAGIVDDVLPPPGIARRLARIAHEPELLDSDDRVTSFTDRGSQEALEQLFVILKSIKRVNFSNYKHSTLRRRINRRMILRRAANVQEYTELLRKDGKEVDTLFKDLLIGVTGFFRDKAVFQVLTRKILLDLIKQKHESGSLRIWVPGCATGEEAYSIAICVSEALMESEQVLNIQIFGTDISEWAITRARAGLYPAASLQHLPPKQLRRYFVRKGDHYQVARSIRDICTFAQQNLCEDPPFSRLDLISCRNVLIYFGADLQKKCFPLFYYALNPHGYLLLGSSETIGGFADLFALVDKKNKIYQTKMTALTAGRHASDSKPSDSARSVETVVKALAEKPQRSAEIRNLAPDIQAAADQLILTHFAPCGVVIDGQFQIWHFRGNTAPFLEHTSGVASLNILKMVRHGLAPDISAAAYQAMKSGAAVRKEGMIVKTPDGPRDIHIEVIPFNISRSAIQWFLVVFEFPLPAPIPAGRGRRIRTQIKISYQREVNRLRSELASTKESLQSIIEEQEAANEEIKSANEEIESSNEELQSTNEELETAKEELQSTNEELTTVNDELNSRNQEAIETNNDLNNLLSSIHLAIIVVDTALTIRRATPLAERLFNIIPTDVGRKLSDINPNLQVPALPGLIRSVLDHLAPREEIVQDAKGQVYSLRVRPYRTLDNVIKGAVIILIDQSDGNQNSQKSPENERPANQDLSKGDNQTVKAERKKLVG